MTPEERANQITWYHGEPTLQEAIAEAIKEAENATVERIASRFREGFTYDNCEWPGDDDSADAIMDMKEYDEFLEKL